MPAVLRRINRIFRRNSRDPNGGANNPNNANRNLHRHRNNPHGHDLNNNNNNNNSAMEQEIASPIKLRSTGYERQSDGSVTLSVTLDKDQVECCVCLSSMTSGIYRCRGNASESTTKTVCHNLCSTCQWQMRRMKSGNGHTKQMQCPICKVKGKFVRNRALERQLLELSGSCAHSKYGCGERFFPWDDGRALHEAHLCVYGAIDCPFCGESIGGGRVNFVEHLVKSSATEEEKECDNEETVPGCKLAFFESKACLDLNQTERNVIGRDRNEFVVNYALGIMLCFVAPRADCPCWKVHAISISPRHGIGGNSRVYIQYCDEDKMSTFMEKEQSLGLITQSLARPVTTTLILTLSRLHPTSLGKLFCDDNSNQMDIEELDDLEQYRPVEFLGESPCSQMQSGFIYATDSMEKLSVRVFTLEESFKVGSVIDARDFTGKWYQAEVIAVQDADGNQYNNLDYDNDEYLQIRKAKIHYLGYSQNYDEWLFVDTDSHRIAQRGTFTVGPDLRAIRRNTTNLANNTMHNHRPNHRQIIASDIADAPAQ
eukprot:507254_1